MSGWQPIETAPRDGTKILGTRLDGRNWEIEVIWLQQGRVELWDTYNGWLEDNLEDGPTHWVPLPEPPDDK